MRLRLLLVVALSACCLVLFLVDRFAAPAADDLAGRRASALAAMSDVDRIVDSQFASLGVERTHITSWYVQTPDKRNIRLQQRILVPREFVSLTFNHVLNRELASIGVHVVATERTKENSVTMHIVKNGVTLRSISFVLQPDSTVR